MAKRGKLIDAASMLDRPEDAAPVAETPRKKVGRKPEPARQGLKPFTLMLMPKHSEALRKAALARLTAGKTRNLDKSEALRSVLDAWIDKGGKAL